MSRSGGRRGLAVVAGLVLLVLTLAGRPPAHAAPPSDLANPAVYPRRGVADLKGLQPDFWPTPADNAQGLGTVSINFFWPEWEPTPVAPPCVPATQVEFHGRCFTVPDHVDAAVKAYSDLGAPATAILYGTPSWARGARPCSPIAPGFEVFCVPDDPADYARFVGLVAQRYDGAHGHGRVSDFVVQNEVNTNDWFDTGCGAGVPCDFDDWLATYAALYNTAYDQVRAAQPMAPVMISLTQHFDPVLDQPSSGHPLYSVQTFVSRLVPLLGSRAWSIAIHPYPKAFLSPDIDARDLPYVTLGNIGVLVGWLRATYPAVPSAWDVQMTEQGINNPNGVFDELQVDVLCRAFAAALGTPGVSSFVYHRLQDNAQEMGLALGLRRIDGSPKPAFALWHDVNDPAAPRCGFEDVPHTVVRGGVDPVAGARWYSSRPLPRGYVATGDAWTLDHDEQPGTVMLYECGPSSGTSTYLTRDVSCGGDVPMGPVGAIATARAAGSTELYLCVPSSIGTAAARVSLDPVCNAGRREVLGFVAGSPPPPVPMVTPSFTG